MLFILTVLVCQGAGQMFRFEEGSIIEGINNDEPAIRWFLAVLALQLQLQVIAAFLFLELVLAAHVPVVGWVGLSLTGVLALLAIFLWVLQATGRKPVAQ